jgi:hypothetical protein
MDDDVEASAAGGWDERGVVERADLSASPEGRAIAAAFVATFGEFVSATVRPVLRDVAAAGGEPQLLVNGLAQLLRDVADSVEFPVDEPRPAAGQPGVDD